MLRKTVADNSWFIIPFLLLMAISLYVVPFGNKEELFLKLQPAHNSVLDAIFKLASNLVEWWGWVVAALLALFKRVRFGIYAVVALLHAGMWTLILKHGVFKGEMRPSFEIDHALLQFVEGVDVHTHNSFPSGHTIAAFSIFMVLTLILSKRYKPWGLVFFFIALAAGYSRVYLNQHYPIDVVAGAAIGVVSCFLVFILSEFIFDKLAVNWAEKSFLSLFTSLG
ncbi:MAG: phosphatase PAP2 family protein [Bacteroidia bacterium]